MKRQREIIEAKDEERKSSGEEDEETPLDKEAVRKIALSLERKINDNIEKRAKNIGKPELFLESELALDEELRGFHQLATTPRFFPELLRLGTVKSLLMLLSHENDDISSDVVSIFREMVEPTGEDEEDTQEDIEGTIRLVEELVSSGHLIELLTQHLQRVSKLESNKEEDKDEIQQTIHETLECFEHIMEVNPAISREKMASYKPFVDFLLERIVNGVNQQTFDDSSSYSCEILSILLHGSSFSQVKLGEFGGIDSLLKTISGFKRRKPSNAEEEEFLENAFDSLCSLLLIPENQGRFDESEGTALMLIISRENVFAQKSAIRTLDFQLQNNPSGCIAFIDFLGLKTLFALLMVGMKSKKQFDKELDEHVISCILSLLKFLEQGERRDRLLNKFTENDFEKVNRLISMFVHYDELLQLTDAKNQRSTSNSTIIPEQFGVNEEEQKLLDRLDSGLFLVQNISIIFAYLSSSGVSSLQNHLLKAFGEKEINVKAISSLIEEFISQLGNENEKQNVLSLLKKSHF